MVLRGPRACGLRPRLWLLFQQQAEFFGFGQAQIELRFVVHEIHLSL